MTRIIRHIRKGLWRLWNIFWPILLIYTLLAILPSAFHQRVSEEFTSSFQALVSHENVEAKFYNPVNLARPWKISYRLHDKYLMADDTVYILGGRNTYDLFLGDYVEKANIDRDILVYETDTAAATVETNQVTLLANPMEAENREPELWTMLQELMTGAEDVVIQTPYIVCSRAMYQDLTAVCESAGSVEIITNAVESGANPFGCTDYLNQKENILETGASVCEFLGDDSTHVKTFLIDDRLSVVGSYNLDMRSTYLDTEMMLAIDCEELTAKLRTETDECKEQSKQNASDGTVQYGAEYQAVELTTKKKAFYAVFRVFIWPIRHLL